MQPNPTLTTFACPLVLAAAAACGLPTEILVPGPSLSPPLPGTLPAESDGGGETSPASCAPSVPGASWAPTWVPPTGSSQGQCAAQDLADLYVACFGAGATDDTCGAYDSDNPACASCVFSVSTDASWGPIVVYDDTTVVNQPGCLALVDPAAGSCAQSAESETECEHAACDASCPVGDSLSLEAWGACAADADQSACAAYDGGCLPALIGGDGGAAASACAGVDFLTAFTNVATVFCGP